MRVKQEEEKEEDVEVIEIDDSSDEEAAEPSVAETAVETPDDDHSNAEVLTSPYDTTISPQDLVTFPPEAAKRLAFPPGCPVRIMPHSQLGANTRYVNGVVQAVSMQFSTREDLYEIQYENSNIKSLWKKEDLQLAPHCPVWFQYNPQAKTAAVVLGTEYYPADPEEGLEAVVLHSLQLLMPPQMIHHGISVSQLKYRSPDEPISDGPKDMAPRGKGQVQIKKDPGTAGDDALRYQVKAER